MEFLSRLADDRRTRLFLLGMLPGLLLALYSRSHWEDWYITFRAGKNLAMGYGLVFQPGEVLQTFTSPLNVLIPAFFSWLTGNHNDELVFWLYTLLGCGLLGATTVLLDRLAQREGLGRSAHLFLLAWFLIDAKIAYFTVNGQEAGFLVFFLALTLVALVEEKALLLGLGWAGLMWSRPDSFVYIGATAIGWLLALRVQEPDRLQAALRRCVQAGLLTVLLYGPWFAWTWWYYGTPIPHSAIAKSLHAPEHPLLGTLKHLISFPFSSLISRELTSLDNLFMPADFFFGGWPEVLTLLSRLLGFMAVLAWLLPRASLLLRSSSIATLLAAFYLQEFVTPDKGGAWYYPSCELLAILTLAGMLDYGMRHFAEHPPQRMQLRAVAAAVLLVWGATSLAMAFEVRVQQAVIESGERKLIGLWLRQHAASPRDTVFVECLGYIGYYSGLKMYDYPGMASEEVVQARRMYGGGEWSQLIRTLAPDWVVLRPSELVRIRGEDPNFLLNYKAVIRFDQSATIATYSFLPGRGYLMHDQTFYVFHRRADVMPAPRAG